PGREIRARVARAVVGSRGDREVAALDYPAVVADQLVLGIEPRELDVPLAADRLLEMRNDRVRPALHLARVGAVEHSVLGELRLDHCPVTVIEGVDEPARP